MAGGGAAPAASESRREAWDRFYGYCFEVIHSSPGVRRLASADRDDCVQDVMLEIVRKFGAESREMEPSAVEGWVRVVSRSKAADIVRRRKRKPEVGFEDGSGKAVAGQSEAAGESLEVGESVSLVWEALLRLDQEVTVTSYLIFFLRQIEGWEVGDIAEAFQITPEQVRFRCHRVKQRFATILKAQGVAPGLEDDRD